MSEKPFICSVDTVYTEISLDDVLTTPIAIVKHEEIQTVKVKPISRVKPTTAALQQNHEPKGNYQAPISDKANTSKNGSGYSGNTDDQNVFVQEALKKYGIGSLDELENLTKSLCTLTEALHTVQETLPHIVTKLHAHPPQKNTHDEKAQESVPNHCLDKGNDYFKQQLEKQLSAREVLAPPPPPPPLPPTTQKDLLNHLEVESKTATAEEHTANSAEKTNSSEAPTPNVQDALREELLKRISSGRSSLRPPKQNQEPVQVKSSGLEVAPEIKPVSPLFEQIKSNNLARRQSLPPIRSLNNEDISTKAISNPIIDQIKTIRKKKLENTAAATTTKSEEKKSQAESKIQLKPSPPNRQGLKEIQNVSTSEKISSENKFDLPFTRTLKKVKKPAWCMVDGDDNRDLIDDTNKENNSPPSQPQPIQKAPHLKAKPAEVNEKSVLGTSFKKHSPVEHPKKPEILQKYVAPPPPPPPPLVAHKVEKAEPEPELRKLKSYNKVDKQETNTNSRDLLSAIQGFDKNSLKRASHNDKPNNTECPNQCPYMGTGNPATINKIMESALKNRFRALHSDDSEDENYQDKEEGSGDNDWASEEE